MSKIEAAIFDAGGVLIKQGTEVSDDIQQELGLTKEDTDLIWKEYIPLLGSGKMTESEFWQSVSRKFGLREISPDEDLLGRAFAKELVIYEPVLELARELGASGVKLAILSDTNGSHARVLEEAGVFEPFDQLFLSHETGIRKPNPQIYELVINDMAIDPTHSIYIDDKADNLVPAANLGMKTVLAKDPEQTIRDIEARL